MDNGKVAFIICYNDEQYLNECLYYIGELDVPQGMTVEAIPVYDAMSMASGYNAAMAQCDARYKVYLHQDVFIIDKGFISKMMRSFKADDSIGLMGVLGTDDVPGNALAYRSWNIGGVYADNGTHALHVKGSADTGGIHAVPVSAIDGMIMITSVDIPWREDIFDGFDHYDLSQSYEFGRRGYKVAVLEPGMPMLLHDCGISKMSRYDHFRRIFCEEYSEYGFEYDRDLVYTGADKEQMQMYDHMTEQLIKAIDGGLMDDATDIILQIDDTVTAKHNGVTTLYNLAAIHRTEKENGERTLWQRGMSYAELVHRFNSIKFVLRRMEFGFMEASLDTMMEVLPFDEIPSESAIHIISEHHLVSGRVPMV